MVQKAKEELKSKMSSPPPLESQKLDRDALKAARHASRTKPTIQDGYYYQSNQKRVEPQSPEGISKLPSNQSRSPQKLKKKIPNSPISPEPGRKATPRRLVTPQTQPRPSVQGPSISAKSAPGKFGIPSTPPFSKKQTRRTVPSPQDPQMGSKKSEGRSSINESKFKSRSLSQGL